MTGTLRKVEPERMPTLVQEVTEAAAARARLSDIMSSADPYLLRIARGELV